MEDELYIKNIKDFKMAFFNLQNIKISAVASAVPTEKVKVESFSDRFGIEYIEKFMESTGVLEFRRTKKYQTASDLAYVAAEHIIKKKDIDRDSIGAIVFIAHSTDYRRPATACVLHKRLGLNKYCAAFDIGLACSAVPYGLYTLGSMMECSDVKRALLLVGETPNKITNPQDKSSTMLIGEGGGAFLLEKDFGECELKGVTGMCKSDGNGYRAIILPGGGFRNPDAPKNVFEWADGNKRSLYDVTMQGDDVFSFTISSVPRTIKEYLALINSDINSFDCLAFHQANKFILNLLCKKLKGDMNKMPLCLNKYGNTSAASIPLLLSDTYGDCTDNRIINTLMSGFGVGLSWGVCSAKLSIGDILPVIETDEIFEEGIINSPEDYYRL